MRACHTSTSVEKDTLHLSSSFPPFRDTHMLFDHVLAQHPIFELIKSVAQHIILEKTEQVMQEPVVKRELERLHPVMGEPLSDLPAFPPLRMVGVLLSLQWV